MPAPPSSRASQSPSKEDPHSPTLAADAVSSLSPEQFQSIARALADPRRFTILQQIAGSDCLMCSGLDAQACISPATISHHLKELQEAGLIEAQRDGRKMRLSLRRPVWDAYIRQLQKI